MTNLNFPEYNFQIVEKKGKLTIFDPVRMKYVALTSEEWVRQHVLRFLTDEKKVPEKLVKVESEISLFKTRKRFDIAVFDRNGNPLLVIECKAPSVPLSQDVLDQAVRYNMTMKVCLLMLTNGLQHIFCRIDPHDGSVRQISGLPDYPFSGLIRSPG
jgi:type I site-specific restriction endonuclease